MPADETLTMHAEGAAPLVSIIVVAYNSRAYLARQLAALAGQTETRWRLILVDNASAADQRPHAWELPANAHLIQSERNLGFAAANNIAADLVDTRFIACLNPDAFPEPDWLQALLDASQRWLNAAAFGSTQLFDQALDRLDGAGDEMTFIGLPYRSLYRAPRAKNRKEGLCFSACAAGALYRTQDFKSLGGFDEDYFCYCEDVDLGYRFRLAGKVTVQVDRAIIRHVSGGASDRAFANYYGARNRLRTFIKCTPPILFWLTALPHCLVTLAIVLVHICSGRGLAGWRGACKSLSELPTLIRARRQTQSKRRVGSLDIAAAMIWTPLVFFSRRPKRA
jgi:GT2 family glycosyltransferase